MEKLGESLRWLLYADENPRFPYRLFIEERKGVFHHFRVQERWPGPAKKIFCKYEGLCKESELPSGEPVESCSILSQSRYGKKFTVILDRKIRKRSWFLFLKKEYKSRPGEYYDQVFWITQSAARGRRGGVYLPSLVREESFQIVIDSNERYPYRFGNRDKRREKLPVGDYGLRHGMALVAIVERKSLDNFLHEIPQFNTFKATLQEMTVYPYKALVFESPYSDFVSPKKNRFYSGAYLTRIIADLMVGFPQIQFVFCQNRKSANHWVYHWFRRIHQGLVGEREDWAKSVTKEKGES